MDPARLQKSRVPLLSGHRPDHGVTEARQPGQKWKARPCERLPTLLTLLKITKLDKMLTIKKDREAVNCRVTGSLFRPPVLPFKLPAKRGPSSGSNVEICQVLSKTVKYRYIHASARPLLASPRWRRGPGRTGAGGFNSSISADAKRGGLAVVIFAQSSSSITRPGRVRRQTGPLACPAQSRPASASCR